MRDTDFLIGVRQKRARQYEDHGFNRHDVPRWALIINGEMGKLNHAMEDLTRALAGKPLLVHRADELRIKVQEQIFESAACMLAMLQECPVFTEEEMRDV